MDFVCNFVCFSRMITVMNCEEEVEKMSQYFKVGKIVNTQGLKGEVSCNFYNGLCRKSLSKRGRISFI